MTRNGPIGRLRNALSAVLGTRGVAEDSGSDVQLLEEDLEASFAEVEADLRTDRDILVLERLLLVLRRRCPVASVRRSPAEGTGRVCFANGTTVLAATRPPGHLSELAVAVMRGRVLLESVRAVGDGVEMVFAAKGGGHLIAYAIGLDQED